MLTDARACASSGVCGDRKSLMMSGGVLCVSGREDLCTVDSQCDSIIDVLELDVQGFVGPERLDLGFLQLPEADAFLAAAVRFAGSLQPYFAGGADPRAELVVALLNEEGNLALAASRSQDEPQLDVPDVCAGRNGASRLLKSLL